MYTPKLREDLVRKLYRMKLSVRKPMTILLAEAVEDYLNRNLKQEADNAEQK